MSIESGKNRDGVKEGWIGEEFRRKEGWQEDERKLILVKRENEREGRKGGNEGRKIK
jgi:hypothetical protein